MEYRLDFAQKLIPMTSYKEIIVHSFVCWERFLLDFVYYVKLQQSHLSLFYHTY